MPDLEQHAVTKWLAESILAETSTSWPPAVRPIETRPEAAALLEELGAILDQIGALDIRALGATLQSDAVRHDLQAIFAQTGAARTLRLLHWLSEQQIEERPALVAALTGGDDAGARALRATIAAVTRRTTLKRTLARDRIAALQSAAEEAMKEHA